MSARVSSGTSLAIPHTLLRCNKSKYTLSEITLKSLLDLKISFVLLASGIDENKFLDYSSTHLAELCFIYKCTPCK